MQDDGYITPAEADAARAEPIVLRQQSAVQTAQADFFIEEVRRQLVAKLGEQGFYEGGLSVRVTLSPDLQATADRALRHGLSAYDRRQAAGAAPGARWTSPPPVPRGRRRWPHSTRASSSATGSVASC